MRANTIVALVTGSFLLWASPLHAQQNGNTQNSTQDQRGQFSESDYRFLEKAARGGLEEVQLGQLAQQKGSNQEVRNFGQRMVTDHSKLNDQLKQIAAQKGATVPSSMSHHENSRLQKLQSATGAEFDRLYAKDMAKDHKHDLKEFQSAAKSLKDADLRNFAQTAVPILQEHATMAETMENSVKSEK